MQLRTSIAFPLLGVLLAGCFNVVPVERATPVVGNEVSLELNDAGRAALAPTMGAAIDQVQGRLIQRDTNQYVVAVSAVQYLRGDSQAWSGASANVSSAYVNKYYQVVFSPGRTIALSALIAGTSAFLIKEFFIPSGSTGEQDTEGPPPIQRVPPGVRIPINPVRTVHALQRILPYLIRH
jgi:hypothetical protein